jgi:hypothetical protein
MHFYGLPSGQQAVARASESHLLVVWLLIIKRLKIVASYPGSSWAAKLSAAATARETQ